MHQAKPLLNATRQKITVALILLAATVFANVANADATNNETTGKLVETVIEVTGVESAEGTIVVVAYSKDNWLGESLLKSESNIVLSPNGDAKPTQTLSMQLPAGEYAFSAYQDVNSNGELDMRLVFPVEPAGFSNKHRPRFGPPRFKKAKLNITESSEPVRIELR